MYSNWTKHLKDPKDKEQFEYSVKHSDVLKRLGEILKEYEQTLEKSELYVTTYDTPNWAPKQAHRNGQRSMLTYINKLIDHKEKDEPTG